MSTEMIRCEISDHIAVVTMDNPPVNAQDQRFHEEMMATFDRLSDEDEVRVALEYGLELPARDGYPRDLVGIASVEDGACDLRLDEAAALARDLEGRGDL